MLLSRVWAICVRKQNKFHLLLQSFLFAFDFFFDASIFEIIISYKKVTFDIQDWYQLDKTEAEYSGGVSGYVAPEEFEQIWIPKLNDMDQNNFDWSAYDADGFAELNHLGIIHSGYGAELGEPDASTCPTENTAANRIWSKGSGMSGTSWQSKDMYTFTSYFLSGAFIDPFCEYLPAKMNQFAHEFLHGYLLLDFYDTDESQASILPGGTGSFDIMANSWGWTYDGATPPHMTPVTRMQVGWLEYIEITQDGFYAIQASEVSGQVYTISEPYPAGEYIIIENRQPVHWDVKMPGGIVIYHVDESKEKNNERGYPGHADWPAYHYQVAIEQADGKYDIENGVNGGDETDFWLEGMTFGPGDMNGATTVWPNTDAYDGSRTGVTIKITSPSRFIMTFEVSGLGSSTTRSNNTTRVAARDPPSTKSSLKWILSMLMGSAALTGLIVLFAM
jgi:M6 family metalloprotease-like protein